MDKGSVYQDKLIYNMHRHTESIGPIYSEPVLVVQGYLNLKPEEISRPVEIARNFRNIGRTIS